MIQQPRFGSTNNIQGNLFVRNLPDSMDSKALMDKFSSYGNILSCKVSFDKETGKSLHYGYVHFSDPAVAKKVLEDINKDVVEEGGIYVCAYEKHQSDATTNWKNCYVGNFPKTWTKENLEELFGKYGPIQSAYVGVKRYNPDKVQGFVNFKEHEDALKAVEGLKDYVIQVEGGEPMRLLVNRLQSREERERANQAYLQEQKKKFVELTKGRFLYVGFGSELFTVERLRSVFEPFGTIESCSIAKDRITKQNKPFGFVCMDTTDHAQEAIRALKEKPELKLKVDLAQTREERAKMLKERRKQNPSSFNYQSYMQYFPNIQPSIPMKYARCW